MPLRYAAERARTTFMGQRRVCRRGWVQTGGAIADAGGAALNRGDAFLHHGGATIYQACFDRPVLERDTRNGGAIFLVRLREVGGVRVHLHAAAAQPSHRATGVEPSRKRDAQTSALRRQRAINPAHGRRA